MANFFKMRQPWRSSFKTQNYIMYVLKKQHSIGLVLTMTLFSMLWILNGLTLTCNHYRCIHSWRLSCVIFSLFSSSFVFLSQFCHHTRKPPRTNKNKSSQKFKLLPLFGLKLSCTLGNSFWTLQHSNNLKTVLWLSLESYPQRWSTNNFNFLQEYQDNHRT